MKGVECFFVGDTDIFSAANVFQKCMFGANAGVVQTGADTVGFSDLAVVVLKDVGAVAVQHAGQTAL